MSTVAPDTRSWFRRHKIRTVIFAFVLLLVLASIFGEDENDPSASGEPAASSSSDDSEPSTDDSTPPSEDEATTEQEPTKQTKTEETKSPRATKKPPRKPLPPPPEAKPRPVVAYLVTRVIDGDTVEVAKGGGGTSVRIIGIDTPETVHPSVPVECGGPRASLLATQLLAGKQVQLVFDPSQGRTDAYGRTLAYLDVRGGGDFGLTMIRRGAAAEYTYDTAYARQGRYRAAEQAARAADRGLWGMCGGPDVPLRTPEPATTQPLAPLAGGGNCAPGYDPCIPPYPPDLDCADTGFVRVTGSDPHGLDADGDGEACE